jgi:hypothetical protein
MSQHDPAAPAARIEQNDAPPRKDQRGGSRRRALKEGKLVFGATHSVIDCTIDNISDGGAHVRMSSSQGVPQDLYLVEASRGIIHKAQVSWRTPAGIGLKLLGPIEDAAAREALLRKFRRG